MRKIRIGKDIEVRWPVLTNGVAHTLDGRDLTLHMKTPLRSKMEVEFICDGCVVVSVLRGKDQNATGKYSLTLWENYGKEGQTAVDFCNAFELVSSTCKEGGVDDGLTAKTVNLEASSIEISTSGERGIPAGGVRGQVLGKKSDENFDAAWRDTARSHLIDLTTLSYPQAGREVAASVSSDDQLTIFIKVASAEPLRTVVHIERVSDSAYRLFTGDVGCLEDDGSGVLHQICYVLNRMDGTIKAEKCPSNSNIVTASALKAYVRKDNRLLINCGAPSDITTKNKIQ